jgi:phage/plasmid-like protein (TIGR03299 family)
MSTATLNRPLARPLMGGAYDLSGVSTAAEARKAAGLDWEPVHCPLYVQLPNDASGMPQGLALMEKERAVVRSDNAETFGVVGREHKLVSNEDFFAFADLLLAEADTTWVAADPVGGSLGGGKQPFLCLQLGEGVQVAGVDAVNCALLLSNGHVGNAAFRGVVNPLRVACGNVVRSSLRALGVASFSIQHSGDIAEKVKEARMGLAITSKYMTEFAAMANRMADIDFSLNDFDDFLAELLPIADDAGERAKTANAEQRGKLRLNWLNTTTLTDDLKRTAWGALNVVTETLDHGDLDVRKSKVPVAERRMNSIHFGTGAAMRDRAYGLLVPA